VTRFVRVRARVYRQQASRVGVVDVVRIQVSSRSLGVAKVVVLFRTGSRIGLFTLNYF
jgi:hypothetical protein